jgi:aminotransferase
MALALSERRAWVSQSEIRNMTIECERAGGINLAQGLCDLEVPVDVRAGARAAIEEGVNVYTRYDGLAELREAVAAKHKRFYGMDVDPETEIVVSAGATGAFYCVCLALLNPGDEVIVFEPYYGYHLSTLAAVQAVPAYVRMAPPDWRFNMEDLERAVTKKTRAMIINTPANPSGKVFTREELTRLAEFCRRHDLFVFTDEIYEYFVFDGKQHIPPATLDTMRERTITISGMSKTFSISGWRIGYCICDARWSRTIGYLNDLIYVCAPAPLQMGAARGLNALEPDYYRRLSAMYQDKRDRLCQALDRAGFDPCIPAGAYYVLCDISRVPGADGKEKTLRLLEKTGVAAVPGGAFYHDRTGENLARFCFAKEDPILDDACSRLERAGF